MKISNGITRYYILSGDVRLCILPAPRCKQYGLKSYQSLFIGTANDGISREFAAQILRSSRRHTKRGKVGA